MVDSKRAPLYDYLCNLFLGTVTDNVYIQQPPTQNTESDTTDGFIVIYCGGMNDMSEFDEETYARCRCFVEAYIPPQKRGRYNARLYKAFEDGITEVIKRECAQSSSDVYQIEQESILSSDGEELSNANNTYFTYIKSFIVTIDKVVEE